MPRRRRPKPHYIINLLLSLITLSLFASTGLRVAQTTQAATAHPYGSADYCALENNQTVIYGWAADPDATALSQPAVLITAGSASGTVQTNRANYRDSAVSDWIDANRTNDPKPGTYGFKIVIPGLVKGTKYPLSGTVLNEGPGSNVILNINNSQPIEGDPTKSFFADNSIPDVCLPTAGAVVAPPAQTAAPPAPKVAVSDITGANVTSGTLAAQITVTTVNTKTVRVMYGENPLKLDQSTSDMPTTSSQTPIKLTGLSAASSYAYRIVRTDMSGKVTTSPLGTFDTLGYVVALHFVDNRDKGITGIRALINVTDKPKTSDDSGTLQFNGVSGGDHTIQYDYLGKTYTKPFTATANSVPPAEATEPHVLLLDYTVNMQALVAAASTTESESITGIIITVGIIIVVTLLAVFGLGIHLRNKRFAEDWLDAPAPPLPEYRPLQPQGPPVVPRAPGAGHMGESLKEMVLHDMHSQRR